MTEQLAPTDRNPLLAHGELPAFGAILPEHVLPAVQQTLAAERTSLATLQAVEEPDIAWLAALEAIGESLHRVWSPVSHLNSVVSTPELRDAFNRCLPLITEFETELAQNTLLYKKFGELDRSLSPAQTIEARVTSLGIRDFRLAGVALGREAKDRFRELKLTLAARQASFEQNLMDASDAFEYHELDRGMLAGLPTLIVQHAEHSASDKQLDGYLFRLDAPTYQAVISHAESPTLREHFYRAWVTRASDQAEHAGNWDNGPLIDEILALRHEAAELLGFENFAELSLAKKMAVSANEVIDFLEDLARRSRPVAVEELATLQSYAGCELKAWDVAYYAEQLKQERFDIAEEALRPYFPLPQVMQGLFDLSERLFEIRIAERDLNSRWDPNVRYYAIHNSAGEQLGGFYTDLFARASKRGGAWMDGCINSCGLHGRSQLPVAHLVCNFSPPVGDAPSLLTHRDIVTLFHEFGHSLHHLLTEISYPSIAGINGVAWDAVELPSQFFENYAWLPEVLRNLGHHFETGEALPEDKIVTLNQSRSFLSGMAMVRQLEFALFDFRLHHRKQPASGSQVASILDQVRTAVAVVEVPAYNRFANSFSHIFGGGYAAGYYSYKWAEVLAADAFAAFQEAGEFDIETAQCFRRAILASGGSRDALDAFVDFRGRPPDLSALLIQAGIEPPRI